MGWLIIKVLLTFAALMASIVSSNRYEAARVSKLPLEQINLHQVQDGHHLLAATGPIGILFYLAFLIGCGSLGCYMAGFLSFRIGMIGVARMWARIEWLAFYTAAAFCALALALAIVHR
jgi:hypothetical protein